MSISAPTLPGLADEPRNGIVNVATVPMRSPFRYPGGKTWLVPRVRQWLRCTRKPFVEFVEPFAGGGIVGLSVAFEGLAPKVLLVELDEDVAAVWQTILNGGAKWLTDQIAAFPMSREAIERVLSQRPASTRARAFATIVRNRANRGGILAPGASMMKLGENGRGLSSRWYPDTLCKRIREIAALRHRIRCLQGDGLALLRDSAGRAGAVFFIDPPYTVAGRRLYRHNDIDHSALFAAAARLKSDFLMTYDDSREIRELASAHGLDVREVPMQTTHLRHKTELLIGRSLDWFTG
ncbi:MAG: DNA adenine methylase [Armatimonadetes bacterium]|nr:DNA adenine methylase [Armatimonadota bacterium]